MGRAHEVRAASMAKTAAAKSKLNAKWGMTIYLAAKSGVPDPDLNLNLRREVARAKKEQVSADVIKRAIEKAKGGSGEAAYIFVRYEGFGPNNSMFMVDCLTNNVNRTVSDVKTAFTKCGFKMGISGCVAHMFTQQAVFAFDALGVDETLELLVENECDVDDITEEDGLTVVYAQANDFAKIRDVLENAMPDAEFAECEVKMIPSQEVELTDPDDIKHYHKFNQMLDELEDVQEIHHNVIGLDDEE